MLALDLHDELAQQLSAFTFLLEGVRLEVSPSQPEIQKQISRVSGLAQQLVEFVRERIYALRPPTLDERGLVETLREYCKDFSERNGITIDLSSSGMKDVRLDFETEINLFRMAQEALTNVKKHSGASRVRIRVQAAPPNITLNVEDDGRGFDVRKETARKSAHRKMGLIGIEQRAMLLGGRLSIESDRNKGSRISVKIPLRVNSDEPKEETSHR